MFVSREREKLLNAIVYFVENTKRCHTLKLFKLLSFLDFEHFRLTGRTVTGLEYKAWPNGPAPSTLWQELASPKPDLSATVAVNLRRDEVTGEPKRRDIRPKKKFDASLFSKRELEIMKRLAFFFDEASAEDMRDVSHGRRYPWTLVFRGGAGSGAIIPYETAFDADPVLSDMPSLAKSEYERRKAAFAEIDESPH